MGAATLCQTCQTINIDRLVADERIFYPSVTVVNSNTSSCRMCKLLWDRLQGYIKIRSEDGKSYAEFHHSVSVRSAEKSGQICFSLNLRPNRDELAIDVPLLAIREYVPGISLKIWTDDIDLARKHRLQWRRRPGPTTRSAESLQIAKEWLQNCKEHRATAKGCAWSRVRPSRLIYCGQDKSQLRLFAPSPDFACSLTALSYVWGIGDAPWKTLKSNLSKRSQGFGIAELPQTLTDAITLTRGLGIEYIWIDALCIVQDDEYEWEQESLTMHDVYSSAEVTIIACSSFSSTSGLFNKQTRTCDDFETYGITIADCSAAGGRTSLLVAPHSPYHQDINTFIHQTRSNLLFRRGWTFQEWLLSPRKLYMTETQLLWECSMGLASEDGFHTFEGSHLYISRDLMASIDAATKEYSKDRMAALERLWYQEVVAEHYSQRATTKQSDRLIAIAGIAKVVGSAIQEDFTAGLWKSSLIAGLCWRRCWRRSATGRRTTQYLAPSWSWASQTYAVEYIDLTMDKLASYRGSPCEVLDVWTRTNSGDGFGIVIGGEITLRAPTFRGHIGKRHEQTRGHHLGLFPHVDPQNCCDVACPGVLGGFVADDESQAQNVAVTAVVIHHSKPTECEYWGILVLEELPNPAQCSTKYRRVGFVWEMMFPARDDLPAMPIETTIIV
ncbi:MAG: hypothetical protein M1820_001961 [Bogoriella megaspora]|nr:MAG: hypothetical protein M1820_001961 [Bogoriella megaspora]